MIGKRSTSSSITLEPQALPVGDSLVTVCARDPQDAQACTSVAVSVAPPSDAFDVAAEIFATDTRRAVDTADPAVAAEMSARLATQDRMRQTTTVVAAAASAADGGSGHNQRRSLLATTGGDAAPLDEVVLTKVMQLLGVVGDYAHANPADAATQRLVSAVLRFPLQAAKNPRPRVL